MSGTGTRQLWSAVRTEPERWLERYLSGESAAVWGEMRDLGPQIRSQEVWRYTSAVAISTMLKVAKNIDTVAGACRLWDTGSPVRLKFTGRRRRRQPRGSTHSRRGTGHYPCPCGRFLTSPGLLT